MKVKMHCRSTIKKSGVQLPVIIIMILIFQTAMAEWVWTKKASMPFGCKRDRGAAFAINGFGFVCTGLDSNNFVMNDLWRYDTSSNSWMQMADFPGIPRRDAVAFVIDSFGFVGTGIDDSSAWGNTLMDFYKYDPDSNIWTQVADYANGTFYGIFRAASATVNNKGYVFCGRYYGTPMGQTWEYNATLDTFIQKASFPASGGRNGAVAFSIGTKAYLTTGSDDNYYYNDLWEFDPVMNSWQQLQNFPGTGRVSAVAFTIDTLGIVGTGSDGGYTDDFWSYNPQQNQWTYLNQLPDNPRRGASAFSTGDYGYLVCGKSATGTKRDVWQLKFKTPVINNTTDNNIHTDVKIFPELISSGNPLHVVKPSAMNLVINFYNIEGKQVCSEKIFGGSDFVSTTTFLTSGIFYARVTDETGTVIYLTKKIVVI